MNINTIEIYLKTRLDLNETIINHLAVTLYEANKGTGSKILYKRTTDNIYTTNKRINVWGFLVKHYTQCRCCGKWYTQNLTNDFGGSSIFIIFSNRLGRDIRFPICHECTLDSNSATIVENKVQHFDYIGNFNDLIPKEKHIKA